MKLRMIVTDSLLGKYIVKAGVKKYSFELNGRQFYLRDGETDLGRIVQNDPFCGSIWHGSECIGEYDLRSGEYVVTPYVDWQASPDKKEKIHPLDYLVGKISSQ